MWTKIFSKPDFSADNRSMQYVNLGKSGLKVSRLCLGCMAFGTTEWQAWTIGEKESRAVVRRALELGINFFDTADVYSSGVSEQILGKALRDFARRDQVVVATKVNGPTGDGANDRGLSRGHILNAVNASLRRLQTDYIDLYQVHRWDYSTPIEETLEALNDLVRWGKVRYCGASSMFAWQFCTSLHTATRNGWARFVSMQNHYNLVYREEEREMIPLCRHEGVALLPWSPLARGLLAGIRRGGDTETLRSRTDEYSHRLYALPGDLAVADRVIEVAARLGSRPSQVALAWLIAQPGITAPVFGARTPEHVEEAAGALALNLESEDMRLIEELYQPHPVLGHE